MAKKLLFNNVISDDGELTPIMDGLICWLDGRDGSGTQTTWVDRMGNYNFELISVFASNDIRWTGTAFNVSGNMTTTTKYGFENSNLNLNNFTLQFNYTLLNKQQPNHYPYIFSCNNRALKMWFEGDYFKILSYSMNETILINTNYIITITYENRILKVYRDTRLILNTTITINPLTTMTIYQDEYATDLTRRQILGDYNSFLMYNRALTEFEIQENFQYEKSIIRR